MEKKLLPIFLSVLLLLCSCSNSTHELTLPNSQPEEASSPDSTDDAGPYAVSSTGQLMCIADTLEDAKKIAELYGITLVEHEYGVAIFYTEEKPQEVIKRGQENGWPQLGLNTSSTIF